ncbi:MAG: glycosyltransferase family 4 protein [Chloroflexia bacterium]
MRLLLAADVFPPRCGGAGWSAYHLVRALVHRGHEVRVILPREGKRGQDERIYGGIPVGEFGYPAPRLPLLRNVFRNEILWPRLGHFLAREVREKGYDLIHAQHSLTVPAAVWAGRAAGVPVVATVRDYWPLCYRATLLGRGDAACAGCRLSRALSCLGVLPALLAYPYMRGNVRRKAEALARADAVIAVSRFLADRLAAIVPAERLHVLPNLVDLEEVDRIVAEGPAVPFSGPFLLFVGKVEANKGVHELLAAFRQVAEEVPGKERLPLVVAGDGSLSGRMERELAALGWPAYFLRWAEHDTVLRLLARCELLLFPSRWEEPLSRVLLEACACGTPILAMSTGGTPEILSDGRNGALVPPEAEAFARRLRELLADPAGRRRLGKGARRTAEERFAAPVVAEQVERLYGAILSTRPGRNTPRTSQRGQTTDRRALNGLPFH